MRKALIILLATLALLVVSTGAAYADYWPPSTVIQLIHQL